MTDLSSYEVTGSNNPNRQVSVAFWNAFIAALEQAIDAKAAASHGHDSSEITGLGTAAAKDTGTSGNTVPLLNAANTWASQQTLTGGAVTDAANGFSLFTGQPSAYRICRNGTSVEIHGAGAVAAYASGTLMWRTNGTAKVFFYKPIDLQSGATYQVSGTQVVTSRRAGWAAPTGTATRTTFATSTVTTAQLAERVKALIDDLTTHGLIGA